MINNFTGNILKKKYKYEKGFIISEIKFIHFILNKYIDKWEENVFYKTIPKKYWELIQEKYQYFSKIDIEYDEINYEEKEQIKLLLQIIPIFIDVNKKFNIFEKIYYKLTEYFT